MPNAKVAGKRSQISYVATIAVIVTVSSAVAAWTWGATPWKWGFPIFYFSFAVVLKLAERIPAVHMRTGVQVALLSFSVPFVFWWFFGGDWTDAATHLGAVAALSITLGLLVGGLGSSVPRPAV